jgi:hypothetical protein
VLVTPAAGVAAIIEVERVLGLAATLDAYIPLFKQRDRACPAGQLQRQVAPLLEPGDEGER